MATSAERRQHTYYRADKRSESQHTTGGSESGQEESSSVRIAWSAVLSCSRRRPDGELLASARKSRQRSPVTLAHTISRSRQTDVSSSFSAPANVHADRDAYVPADRAPFQDWSWSKSPLPGSSPVEYRRITARQMVSVSACACARVIPDLRRPARSGSASSRFDASGQGHSDWNVLSGNTHVRCSVHGGAVERASHHAHDHERMAVQHDRRPTASGSPLKRVARSRSLKRLEAFLESPSHHFREGAAKQRRNTSTSKRFQRRHVDSAPAQLGRLIHHGVDQHFPDTAG